MTDPASGDKKRRPESTAPGSTTGAGHGHNPLAGRAHLVNRADLHEEANAGPGSLDPKTLAPPKAPEARRWLAKKGIELEVPAGWRYLGIAHDGRSLTFVSDVDAAAHAIEIHTSSMPEDINATRFLAAQDELCAEAVELQRVLTHRRQKLGQAEGILVVGWGPETQEALAHLSDEDLYLGTDGTGRRALSWRGLVARNGEQQLFIVALSSPMAGFPDAKPVFDAILDRAGVWVSD